MERQQPEAVLPLTPLDIDHAAETLRLAFDSDPIYTHIFPNANDRARYLPPFWRALVDHALSFGQTYMIGNADGVAAWLSPQAFTQPPTNDLGTLLALQVAIGAFPEPARSQFLAISNHADGLHPQLMAGRAHWYLWVIGVRPERQGKGLGGRLIAPILATADAESTPCYLETESARNVGFYRRHGFEVIHETVVPGEGLHLWMMVREPRAES